MLKTELALIKPEHEHYITEKDHYKVRYHHITGHLDKETMTIPDCFCGECKDTEQPLQLNPETNEAYCPKCGEVKAIVYAYNTRGWTDKENYRISVENARIGYDEWSGFYPFCSYVEHMGEVKKEIIQKQQKEELEKAEERNQPLMLVCTTNDLEAMGELYSLNKRIEYEDWKKIKDYFTYYTPDKFIDDTMVYGEMTGWMCSKRCVPAVEEILGITETVEKQEKEAQKQTEEYEEEQRKQRKLRNELENTFETKGTRPEATLKTLKQNSEVYDDPEWSYQQNSIYGGGKLYIIQDTQLWHIQNNGFDGAYWGENNIKTGGAGAIGYMLPYSDEIAEKIRQYGNKLRT